MALLGSSPQLALGATGKRQGVRLDSSWVVGIPASSLTSSVAAPASLPPVVVVRRLKRQQAAAVTNFVGCFLLAQSYFSLLLSALNDLTGHSSGPLA